MPGTYYGSHDRKLDYKGRLGIPDDVLTAGGEVWPKAVIIRDSSALLDASGEPFRFIGVYDIGNWQELLETIPRTMDEDQIRLFMERVVGDAATVDVDGAKRVTVPERFLQYASIERQAAVRLVGAINHVEIWSPDVQSSYIEALEREDVRVPSIADLVRERLREIS